MLVVAAELDRLLLLALQNVLAPSQAMKELVKDNDGPMSTFSARTNLARALKLIDDGEWRDINIMRKIRNDFAHKTEASFDQPPISDRVRELSAHTTNDGAVETFERTALFLMMQIQAAIEGTKQFTMPTMPRVYGPDADDDGE